MLSPLAQRMRPTNLGSFFGQKLLLENKSGLKSMLESNQPHSMILWGPPGCGKTTLSQIIAEQFDLKLHILSAVDAGVKDIRAIVENSRKQDMFQNNRPILFLDEIHRFNKSQQDSLLKAIELGEMILIGATTENPSFAINSALISRMHIYKMQALAFEDICRILDQAIISDIVLQNTNVAIKDYKVFFEYSSGDARKALNFLEIICNGELTQVSSTSSKENKKSNETGDKNKILIDRKLFETYINDNTVLYDKQGEMHYDIISAFIKSIRGSDPDATVYWLARMVVAGEDPRFIARRLVILAAEDIGLANATALVVAQSCMAAVEKIGWPEARIILSEAALYLANSAKSNTAYLAINNAIAQIKSSPQYAVPLSLRNPVTNLMKKEGYGKEYKYSHNFNDNGVANFAKQEFLPQEIQNEIFYQPAQNAKEREYFSRLKKMWPNKKR